MIRTRFAPSPTGYLPIIAALPLRVALAGSTQTPSIDAIAEMLGRDTTLSRLRRTISGIKA